MSQAVIEQQQRVIDALAESTGRVAFEIGVCQNADGTLRIYGTGPTKCNKNLLGSLCALATNFIGRTVKEDEFTDPSVPTVPEEQPDAHH